VAWHSKARHGAAWHVIIIIISVMKQGTHSRKISHLRTVFDNIWQSIDQAIISLYLLVKDLTTMSHNNFQQDIKINYDYFSIIIS